MTTANSPDSATLRGSETPRLFTEPLRRLTPETSEGYVAIEFIERVLGQPLMPWQRWWLVRVLELDRSGGFRYRTVLTLVARQNGKTTLLKYLALYFMYMGRARLVLGAAQSLDMARESWQGVVDFAHDIPSLAREVDTVRRANGDQELKLTNGARYRITAASRSAGRGLSVDLLILDELREHQTWDAWAALSKTTMARPSALTVAISNQGDDRSVVLNQQREVALAGLEPSAGIFEWSAPDGCELDDPAAWSAANPGLGHTITPAAIRSAISTDNPATFRTEVLCQRVDSLADVAVGSGDWNGCYDPAMTLEGLREHAAMAVDVSPDLAHASLVAAATGPDGRVRVEALDAWSGPNAARLMLAALPGWRDRVKPKAFGYFPAGPAAAVKVELEKLGAVPIPPGDTTPACQALAELVLGRRLLHAGDPLLTGHVLGAKKWNVGDGWRFVRRGAGHVDAAYATAGAVHLVRTLPAPPRAIVIVGRRSA